MNISKTVSITAATRRTAAKQGIDVGADELRYLDNTLTPSERSAATKAALVAAPFAQGRQYADCHRGFGYVLPEGPLPV